MRDYITTIFNLIVGLIDADKIVYLALIGLGLLLVFQLISLIANFHRRFANRCRKISKFLTKNGLSANNYNQFLALVAKMPQEFIRGYKTFEHASYGLPSDYIKRFDSLDVEVNGGLLNHGKSLFKALIYGWTIILALLSFALLGTDTVLSGFAIADALLVPVLFLILAKIVYFIFNAIKQQQYKMAVDEFNEMLDIMNDKIENNDNIPGPDILAESLHAELPSDIKATAVDDVAEKEADKVEPPVYFEEKVEIPPVAEEEIIVAERDPDVLTEEELIGEVVGEEFPVQNFIDEEIQEELQGATDLTTEENTEVTINEEPVEQPVEAESHDVEAQNDTQTTGVEAVADSAEESDVAEFKQPAQKVPKERKPRKKIAKEESQGESMEEKRGRGRPRKIAEGDLVITNDKQFEEVLQRAEKLMRKSEEALSSSQSKRVEKSLKELIDAMQKYKEEH